MSVHFVRSYRPPFDKSLNWLPPLVLCLIWLVGVALVRPVGDFPLNDSWAYGEAVRRLLEEGRLSLPHWVSMPLVTQVLWGGLFAQLGGFSFNLLRFSTLVLALLALVACYGVLREAGARRTIAFVAGLTLAFNPLFFNLSLTFMTDVPFLAFVLMAVYALTRGTERGQPGWVVLGALLLVAATLVRELAILVGPAFALYYLMRRGVHWRVWVVDLVVVMLPVVAYLGFRFWVNAQPWRPAWLDVPRNLMLQSLGDGFFVVLGRFLHMLARGMVYLGLFSAPFLVACARPMWREGGRFTSFMALWALGSTFIMLALRHQPLPFIGNVFYDFGLGPATLADALLAGGGKAPFAPAWFWALLTWFGALGGGYLFANVWFAVPEVYRHLPVPKPQEPMSVDDPPPFPVEASWCAMAVVAGGLFLSLYSFNVKSFDRYYLPLLPWVFILIVQMDAVFRTRQEYFSTQGRPFRQRYALLAALLLVAASGLFSVLATHDYFSWNRARWMGLRSLMEDRRVAPECIDGGFEFNGMYTFAHPFPEGDPQRWWWVRGDEEYVVTFAPLEGYEVAERFSYRSWMPYREDAIWVLRRLP